MAMPHRRPAWLASVALSVAGLTVVAGCADDAGTTEDHRAAVYAAVVRAAIATADDATDKFTVVLAPVLDFDPFAIGVQADVLELTEDLAHVRFVDAPDEALGKDSDTVRDGVDLVMLLGPLEGSGAVLEVAAEIYRSSARGGVSARFSVTSANGEWTAVELPDSS